MNAIDAGIVEPGRQILRATRAEECYESRLTKNSACSLAQMGRNGRERKKEEEKSRPWEATRSGSEAPRRRLEETHTIIGEEQR